MLLAMINSFFNAQLGAIHSETFYCPSSRVCDIFFCNRRAKIYNNRKIMILTENFTEFSTAASVMIPGRHQFHHSDWVASSSSDDLTESGMSFFKIYS